MSTHRGRWTHCSTVGPGDRFKGPAALQKYVFVFVCVGAVMCVSPPLWAGRKQLQKTEGQKQ